MLDKSQQFATAILSTIGRIAFSPEKLLSIVRPPQGGSSDKQIRAYNMCDGEQTQAEIAKALKLDPGNFSRTVGRWIDAGILFRIGSGRDAALLHLYPLGDIPVQVSSRGTRSRKDG